MRKLSLTLSGSLILLITCSGLSFSEGPKHKRSVALGLNMTSGNSDTLMTTAAFTAKTETEKNITLLEIDGAYGETKTESDENTNTDVTTQNAKGHGNYKKMLNSDFGGYLDACVTHDRVADVDYRAMLGTGASVFLVKTTRTEVSIDAGVGYLWEDVAEISNDYLTLRLAQRGEITLNDKSKVWQTIEYLPKADDLDDYLLNVEAGIEAAAAGNLSLRFIIQNKHDSAPAPGKEKTDTIIIAALSWSL